MTAAELPEWEKYRVLRAEAEYAAVQKDAVNRSRRAAIMARYGILDGS
jgi:hypothetical protein